MDIERELLGIIDQCLGLKGRAATFTSETALLGGIPELDSLAVVALLTALEERFGITIHDDEIDGAAFSTVGTLTEFVAGKVGK